MQDKTLPPHIHYNKSLSEKARKLRRESTPAERTFWKLLRRMSFFQEAPFNRQKPLGEFIVDFYSHRLKLVIEIDGDTHGSEPARKRDDQRTSWLEAQGLKVLRFTNLEVMSHPDGVIKVLEDFIESLRKEAP